MRILRHPASLYAAALLYTACGLLLSVRLYHNLHMFIWDMGVFDQVVWNTAHARWFASSTILRSFPTETFQPKEIERTEVLPNQPAQFASGPVARPTLRATAPSTPRRQPRARPQCD